MISKMTVAFRQNINAIFDIIFNPPPHRLQNKKNKNAGNGESSLDRTFVMAT